MESMIDVRKSLETEEFSEEVEGSVRKFLEEVELETSIYKEEDARMKKSWIGMGLLAAVLFIGISLQINNLGNKFAGQFKNLGARVGILESLHEPPDENINSQNTPDESHEFREEVTAQLASLEVRIQNIDALTPHANLEKRLKEIQNSIKTIRNDLASTSEAQREINNNINNIASTGDELFKKMAVLSGKLEILDRQNKRVWSGTKFDAVEKHLAKFKNGQWSATKLGEEKLGKAMLKRVSDMVFVSKAQQSSQIEMKKGGALLGLLSPPFEAKEAGVSQKGFLLAAAKAEILLSSHSDTAFDENAFLDILFQMGKKNSLWLEQEAVVRELNVRQLVGTILAYAHTVANKPDSDLTSKD